MLKIICSTILQVLSLILSLVLFQGCHPVYKTNYIYHPVPSEKARGCANECIENKQGCRSQCLDLQRQCERDANMLAVASDLININRQTHDSGSTTVNSIRSNLLNDCYRHYDSCVLSCDEDHKLCHENCGGEVTIQTVCVKNCEKK